MKTKWKTTGAGVSLCLLGAAAAAAQTWTITIGPNNAVTSTLQEGSVNVITQSQATVNVSCQSGVDCSKADLQLQLNGTTVADLGPPASTASGLAFTISKGSVSDGTDLAVLFGGNK